MADRADLPRWGTVGKGGFLVSLVGTPVLTIADVDDTNDAGLVARIVVAALFTFGGLAWGSAAYRRSRRSSRAT